MLKKLLMASMLVVFMLFILPFQAFAAQVNSLAKKPVPRIEICKKDKMLRFYLDGKLQKEFPIAIGRPKTPTSSGTFKIIEKEKNPEWNSIDGKHVSRSDPNNPLGERWMRLGEVRNDGTVKRRNLGIHGTNNPKSIGTQASGGCIRLNNKDVEWLYDQVPIGTIVIIKDK